MVEELALQPLVKLAYNQALENYHTYARVEAVKAMNEAYGTTASFYSGSVWNLTLMTGLGLTANSDIVSLYLEPQLGLSVESDISTDASAVTRLTTESYGLA